ncbi:hypothetical protein [Limnoglobus roseus]|uniref:Apea-like HEPN domain-containing protein n=1 Tax=Limnoglobus roseus TaxID=2598579 RepID=A0A5C1A8Z6_9BACT|nr:hypothetical protein [Limnoglobus roseus]QEL14516.1 hypothetical protein PX52LOC_01406 [Limnoglobus roseus]
MASNLLLATWTQLDSHELRLLLDHRIGGPGQYDRRESNPHRIHLPRAKSECRVTLTYSDRRIASVEPGPAFDQSQWDAIVQEIETKVLTGPDRIGREYSFCSHRVPGSWRGDRSGIQILPPHPESPTAPAEYADHPFILEFPIRDAGNWAITNHRRLREHRRLTLMLNTVLAGGMSLQRRSAGHSWGCFQRDDGQLEVRWVKNAYSGFLGECVLELATPLSDERLEVIPADRYFEEMRGIDGRGLRVPSDLDESICCYQQLPFVRREEFDRAAYWLHMASRQWTISMSSSFGALVSAVESLINQRGQGSTRRFRTFLEEYAPGASLEARRQEMYDLRSGIFHGSDLMVIDQDISFGWDPPWWNERELHEELWGLTRTVIRNWLRNPPPT